MKKRRIGKLGDKYCKYTWDDGSIDYSCASWHDTLTDKQIKELGLNKNRGKFNAKSELENVDFCQREWKAVYNKLCKEGESPIYHGTSQENAKKIMKQGFKPKVAYFGTGVYFGGPYIPYVNNFEANTAIRYALRYEKETVIAGCIPTDQRKSSKDTYTIDKDTGDYHYHDWGKKLRHLQSESPESLGLYFAWHGDKFDTMEAVKRSWYYRGKKVQDLALKHGVRAWTDNGDGGQTVIYDPKLLKEISFVDLFACRTKPLEKNSL